MPSTFGRTFGAAIGAAIVILFLATVATNMAQAAGPAPQTIARTR